MESQGFPYSLTFCRPSKLDGEGSSIQKLFGVVSDGSSEPYHVTVWPSLTLPFPLSLRTVLSLRCYSAASEVEFKRGEGRLIAQCYFPLRKLSDGYAPTHGLKKIWLALDMHWPQDFFSLPNENGQATQDLAALVDQSLRLARGNPNVPRLCIIVQPQPDVNAKLPWPTQRGLTDLSPRSPSDLARERASPRDRMTSSDHSSPGPLYASSFSQSLANGLRMPSLEQAPNMPSSPRMRDARSLSALPGDLSPRDALAGAGSWQGPLDDSQWRIRWAELHAEHEGLKQLRAQDIQIAQLQTRRREIALERIGERCLVRLHRTMTLRQRFDHWLEFMLEMKRARQFEQLQREFDRLQHMRQEELEQASCALDNGRANLMAKEAELETLLVQRSSQMASIEDAWRRSHDLQLLGRVVTSWRDHHHREGQSWFVLKSLGATVGRRGDLAAAFGEWVSIILTIRHEKQEQRLRLVPGQVKRACANRVESVLIWASSAFVERRTCEFLHWLFKVWGEFTVGSARGTKRISKLLGGTVLRVFDSTSLHTCMLAWQCVLASSKSDQLAISGDNAKKQVMLVCMQRIKGLIGAMHYSNEAAGAQTALLCWRFSMMFCKEQHAIEQIYAEQQAAEAEADQLRKERAAMQEERAQLVKQLETFQAKANEGDRVVRQALEEHDLVEALRKEMAQRNQTLQGELAGSHAACQRAEEQLKQLQDGYETACEAAGHVEQECKAEAAAALQERQKFQAEAAKLRDKKGREVKEAKNWAKVEIEKLESRAQRAEKARTEDQESFKERLRQVDGRSKKVDQELRRARDSISPLEERQSELQSENEELSRRLEASAELAQKSDVLETTFREELKEFGRSYDALRTDYDSLASLLQQRMATSRNQAKASSDSPLSTPRDANLSTPREAALLEENRALKQVNDSSMGDLMRMYSEKQSKDKECQELQSQNELLRAEAQLLFERAANSQPEDGTAPSSTPRTFEASTTPQGGTSPTSIPVHVESLGVNLSVSNSSIQQDVPQLRLLDPSPPKRPVTPPSARGRVQAAGAQRQSTQESMARSLPPIADSIAEPSAESVAVSQESLAPIADSPGPAVAALTGVQQLGLSRIQNEATASPSFVPPSSPLEPALGQASSGSFLRSLNEGLLSSSAGSNTIGVPQRTLASRESSERQFTLRPAQVSTAVTGTQVSPAATGIARNGSPSGSVSSFRSGGVDVEQVEAEVNKLREENASIASDIDREQHIIEEKDSQLKKLQEQIEQARLHVRADSPDTAARIRSIRALTGNK